MVSIGAQSNHRLYPIRLALRLRRRIPGITSLRLAPGIRHARRKLCLAPDHRKGRTQGLLCIPLHLPQLQWTETFGLGHGQDHHQQASHPDRVVGGGSECCHRAGPDLYVKDEQEGGKMAPVSVRECVNTRCYTRYQDIRMIPFDLFSCDCGALRQECFDISCQLVFSLHHEQICRRPHDTAHPKLRERREGQNADPRHANPQVETMHQRPTPEIIYHYALLTYPHLSTVAPKNKYLNWSGTASSKQQAAPQETISSQVRYVHIKGATKRVKRSYD